LLDAINRSLVEITVFAGFAVAATALGLLLAKPSERNPATGHVTLRYSRAYIGFGAALALGGFALNASLFLCCQQDPNRWYVVFLLPALTLPGLLMVLEGFRKRVILDGRAIWVRGWFGKDRCFPWSDIVRVENADKKQQYTVRTATDKFTVNHQLDHAEWFAEECVRRLQPGVYGLAFCRPPNSQVWQ
jgi:hypothetical protein